MKNTKIARVIHQAAKGGFNFNDAADNGIAIPSPHGSHPEYTQDIADDIIANISQAKTPEGTAALLRSIVQDRRDNLSVWFDF